MKKYIILFTYEYHRDTNGNGDPTLTNFDTDYIIIESDRTPTEKDVSNYMLRIHERAVDQGEIDPFEDEVKALEGSDEIGGLSDPTIEIYTLEQWISDREISATAFYQERYHQEEQTISDQLDVLARQYGNKERDNQMSDQPYTLWEIELDGRPFGITLAPLEQ